MKIQTWGSWSLSAAKQSYSARRGAVLSEQLHCVPILCCKAGKSLFPCIFKEEHTEKAIRNILKVQRVQISIHLSIYCLGDEEWLRVKSGSLNHVSAENPHGPP